MNENIIVSQFTDAVLQTGATLDIIPSSPEFLSEALLNAVSGFKNIILSEPQFISASLLNKFKKKNNLILFPDAEQLSSADVGITDAFAGVARTGSVCVSIRSDLGSYVSLLPKKHIVILESKNIVERPGDIFEQMSVENLKKEKNWLFISGPSATADMGELVMGAHGPAELHIILLE